jgi:hypothetical protein
MLLRCKNDANFRHTPSPALSDRPHDRIVAVFLLPKFSLYAIISWQTNHGKPMQELCQQSLGMEIA